MQWNSKNSESQQIVTAKKEILGLGEPRFSAYSHQPPAPAQSGLLVQSDSAVSCSLGRAGRLMMPLNLDPRKPGAVCG
jgi:hypothetical protein